MLSYFLALLFLKKVSGVLDYNLRLAFGCRYKRAKEFVAATCNRVFIGEHDQGRLVPLRQDLPGMPHFSGSGVIRADGDEERIEEDSESGPIMKYIAMCDRKDTIMDYATFANFLSWYALESVAREVTGDD